MSDPYVGEIKMFGGNFAPVGWMFCDGSPLQISQYDVLFNLIGTTYGGDGQTTFNLPDLRGRLPIHKSGSFPIGMSSGVETVTLNTNQMPAHPHAMMASKDVANAPNPRDTVLAVSPQLSAFLDVDPTVAMSPQFLGGAGSSQPHNNMQPYLCVSFIISLYGIYPPPP